MRRRTRKGARIDFSDVGKVSDDRALSPKLYLRAENSCVRALRLASKSAKVDKFELAYLRLTPSRLAKAVDFGGLSKEIPVFYSDFPLGVSDLSDAVRLILRGGIWCVLRHPHLEVHFPGGCAMVIGTDLEFDRVLQRIERRGFSVEPVDRPTYEWEIGD